MTKPIRILVTGSRYLDGAGTIFVWAAISSEILAQVPGRRDVVFVHGDANGVDEAVRRWVDSYRGTDITQEPHPADWSKGNGGGPMRNAAMVALGADLCLAFPRRDSKGTWGCIRLAANAGIPVRIYPLPKITGATP